MEPVAYLIDDDTTYRNACRKLATVPVSQWPGGQAAYDRVYLGVRLYEMERYEQPADIQVAP